MEAKWDDLEINDSLLEDSSAPDIQDQPIAMADFVKQSFQTVLNLHEEVISAHALIVKEIQEENSFLKDNLLAVQKAYAEDRELLEILKKEILDLQEELEFTRRKYKMMWNQAIENYSKKS